MRKTRLLTLLVLLITAATGAWAQTPTTYKISATVTALGQTKTATIVEDELPYSLTLKECYMAAMGSAPSSMLTVKGVNINSGTNVSVSDLSGWNTGISVNDEGEAQLTVTLNAGTARVAIECEKNLPVADASGNYEKWASQGMTISMADLFAIAGEKGKQAKIIIDRCLAEIGFDADAVSAISGSANISFTGAYDGTVTLIGDDQVLGSFDFTLVDGNSQAISFGNGKVTVQMPFSATIPAGKELAVWFLENNQKSAQIPFTYENGMLTFFPPHFSKYVVLLQDIQQNPSGGSDTYTVTLNDGNVDTQNWTITPAEATTTGVAAGQTVTLKYDGGRKVKSITAKVDMPAGITVARAPYQGTNAPSQDWKAGDKLYVYGLTSDTKQQVLMGTLEAETDGAEAFMAGTLDFTKTGTTTPMTLTLSNLPLPLDYSTQDGKLSTINQTMNYATATATATVIDGEAGTVLLDAKPTLVPKQALVKFTLQDARGTAINVLSLFVNLDNATYNYSTINQMRYELSNEGAGEWIYGNATYENGVITLPKAGGCGCGWKPELWEGVDLTKYTGITCEFAKPVEGDCQFFVAYMIEGDQDQHYSGTSVSDGATYAWVGVPSDAIQINGIYFALNNVVDNDVKVYPGRLNLAKIGGYILHPNASEVYVTFNGTEPNAKLWLNAEAGTATIPPGNKDYIYRATGVTYAEGFYYEQIVRMTPNN